MCKEDNVQDIYDETLSALRETFENFMDDAEKGKDGRGSKTYALNARKLISKMTLDLKAFRVLSVSNDRNKPTQKRQSNADSA